MKRIWYAVAFLLISIGICIGEQVFVKNVSQTLNNDIYKIECEINAEQNTDESIDKINADYEKFESKLEVICDNSQTIELKTNFIELKNLDDAEKIKALAEARALVETMYKNQKLSLTNIL